MLGYEYLNRTDLVHIITEQKGIGGNPQFAMAILIPTKPMYTIPQNR
jgi:hypothetical protein